MDISNLVVKIKILLNLRQKIGNIYLLVGSFNETKYYQYLLLHHMVALKSKFFFKNFNFQNNNLLILDFSKLLN